jgi:hypothetical protein
MIFAERRQFRRRGPRSKEPRDKSQKVINFLFLQRKKSFRAENSPLLDEN